MENTQWIKDPVINVSEVARKLQMNPSLFRKKLNQKPVNAGLDKPWSFTDTELTKIEQVRQEIIESLLI